MATDPHPAADHHVPNVKAYFVVFGALSIFTAVSFVANSLAHEKTISKEVSFAIILGIAVIKAVLVGMIFMHLKWDWGKLFFMIIPAFIIATMMIVVFLPDIVIAWHTISPVTPISRPPQP